MSGCCVISKRHPQKHHTLTSLIVRGDRCYLIWELSPVAGMSPSERRTGCVTSCHIVSPLGWGYRLCHLACLSAQQNPISAAQDPKGSGDSRMADVRTSRPAITAPISRHRCALRASGYHALSCEALERAAVNKTANDASWFIAIEKSPPPLAPARARHRAIIRAQFALLTEHRGRNWYR